MNKIHEITLTLCLLQQQAHVTSHFDLKGKKVL